MGNFVSQMVLRPPRASYDASQLPASFKSPSGLVLTREPVSFVNSRGQQTVGSLYPAESPPAGNPTVIHLHGSASCQLEGLFVAALVHDAGIGTLALDLSGSGNSGGEVISLGYYERDDVRCAAAFLRSTKSVSKIILWGRSMGASLALWCGGEAIEGVVASVADSPYASVRSIIEDVSDRSWALSLHPVRPPARRPRNQAARGHRHRRHRPARRRPGGRHPVFHRSRNTRRLHHRPPVQRDHPAVAMP
jgi:pimeloyl-ACP methyl ester carboxylesterase